MQRNAAITSEAPKSSCSTCEIAELKATSVNAMVTCDQPGCETGVGGDMSMFLKLGEVRMLTVCSNAWLCLVYTRHTTIFGNNAPRCKHVSEIGVR